MPLDHADTTLIVVALIGLGGTLAVGILNLVTARLEHRKAETGRIEVQDAIAPSNGHGSIGEAIASIEERLIRAEQRDDIAEVKLSETLAFDAETRADLRSHISETLPLAAWVRREMQQQED